MSNILKQLIKQSRNVRLSDSEKQSGRDLLMAHIASNPAMQKSRNFLQRFFCVWAHPIPIVLSVVLLCGAGTSYAAEDAVPGDPLYPIKIHINESVRFRLAVTANAKAQWKTQQVERRLNEVAKLAQKGKLTVAHQVELTQEVKARMKDVQESIKEMRAHGKAERASSTAAFLELSVKNNAEFLDTVTKKQGTDPKEYNEMKKEFKKAARESRDEDNDLLKKNEDSGEVSATSSTNKTKLVPVRRHKKEKIR